MKFTKIPAPELALMSVTRAIAGAGLGLLFANVIPKGARTLVGGILLGVGALSTIPFAMDMIRRHKDAYPNADESMSSEVPRTPPSTGARNDSMTH